MKKPKKKAELLLEKDKQNCMYSALNENMPLANLFFVKI